MRITAFYLLCLAIQGWISPNRHQWSAYSHTCQSKTASMATLIRRTLIDKSQDLYRAEPSVHTASLWFDRSQAVSTHCFCVFATAELGIDPGPSRMGGEHHTATLPS